ncbi:MAG: RsmD family RNA methyltransferase [Chitinivibrionales bacterium]|nr:RsmD family RNA methyltransferase [Chitinivibrionales bacterium]
MKLRIIAGDLKGRQLHLSGAAERFRPTKEMVRKAVSDTIRDRISGAVIGDLCAGSGAFGFEMLSRGAAAVHFVEIDKVRVEQLHLHIEAFGLSDRGKVHRSDVRRFLALKSVYFDIIYFDPPYEDSSLQWCIEPLLSCVNTGGLLIHERQEQAVTGPRLQESAVTLQSRTYGKTTIDYYLKRI